MERTELRHNVPSDEEARRHIENVRSKDSGWAAIADWIESGWQKSLVDYVEPPAPECPLCGDTGYHEWEEVHRGIVYQYAEECICRKRARQIKRLEMSNLPDTKRMRLDTYRTEEEWQERALKYARAFTKWMPATSDDAPPWFFIGGQPGSGKTHLCTGICVELISQGHAVMYQIWADLAEELKENRNRESFRSQMKRLQEVDILYLDDFLRGNVSHSSLELAWEILNGRYNKRRRTIISSEHFIQEIIDRDHALGGRIHEMTRGYHVPIKRDAGRDQRTKGGEQIGLQV